MNINDLELNLSFELAIIEIDLGFIQVDHKSNYIFTELIWNLLKFYTCLI